MTASPGPVDWQAGRWLNRPPEVDVRDGDLVVTTRRGSAFWRRTAHGFVHDDGHALLAGLPTGSAVEVTFEAAFTERYRQAGALVRVDESTWTKAGIEFTDGALHAAVVVTRGSSDWSMAPVPEWAGVPVTVRASRSGDEPLQVRFTAFGIGPADTALHLPEATP